MTWSSRPLPGESPAGIPCQGSAGLSEMHLELRSLWEFSPELGRLPHSYRSWRLGKEQPAVGAVGIKTRGVLLVFGCLIGRCLGDVRGLQARFISCLDCLVLYLGPNMICAYLEVSRKIGVPHGIPKSSILFLDSP